MKIKKKTNKTNIIKLNTINYTFIGDAVPQKVKKQENNREKKLDDITRKTLKDSKTTKTHYNFKNKSPKSQQNHSPVYE